MRAPLLLRLATLAGVAGAAVVAAGGSAGAVDDAKPAPCPTLNFSDAAGDNTNAAVPAPTEATDILGGFIKHDPAKGDEATTFNIQVKNLVGTVPAGYTTVSWVAYFPGEGGETRWVRAVADFGGGVEYEYGYIADAVATTVSLYEGDTKGKLFEGPDGIVQIVVPAGQIKPGSTVKGIYANALQSQIALPPSTNAPVRGSSWVMDRAPDDEGDAEAAATLSPCGDPGAPLPAPAPVAPGKAPAAAPSKLPVTLASKSVKRAKSALTVKLRAKEKVTNLSAQLRKGRKVVGKGSLKQLKGNGSLKLKVKGLKKGAHVLDLAGTASGKRLVASYKLTVK